MHWTPLCTNKQTNKQTFHTKSIKLLFHKTHLFNYKYYTFVLKRQTAKSTQELSYSVISMVRYYTSLCHHNTSLSNIHTLYNTGPSPGILNTLNSLLTYMSPLNKISQQTYTSRMNCILLLRTPLSADDQIIK